MSPLTFFISRQNELAEQLRAAKLEKERFLKAEEDQTIQQTQELIEALEAGPDFLDAFDGELFRELVDKIIVESNDRVQVRRQERTTPCQKSPAQKELREAVRRQPTGLGGTAGIGPSEPPDPAPGAHHLPRVGG